MINLKKLKYDTDQILGYFELKRGNNCEILNKLTDVNIHPNFEIPGILEKQRQKLELEGDLWNEEELKMHFLSFVFVVADFEVYNKMKLFYERSISATVQDTLLTVKCDALLAAPYGINTPQKPYFFMQEFKKGKKSNDDAEGQMLTAMLIAQAINNNDQPVYSCYLLGKDWHFTTLHQKDYCFSKSYDATQTQELVQILHILGNLKNVIQF
jgi:hypothetical protein